MKTKLLLLAAAGALALVIARPFTHADGGISFTPITAQSQPDSEIKARIARIENGLLPAVVIQGQPAHAMNIGERMKLYKVPGMSVAFFDHGQIIWTKTYGLADVDSKKPVTPTTLFQAASISKPVSALAALRLVQQGKLSLDEDVNVKLRTWKVPENQFTKEQKVTLRRILSHSAGLTVHGFPGYATDDPIPTIMQVLNGEKPSNTEAIRVDTVPGTLWRYSGGGYVVMQLLLTDLTSESFPKIMHDMVLHPAGMLQSTYEQPLPKAARGFAATAYKPDGQPVKGNWHIYPEMAPAGLWTTPSDLARLAIEVQNEYNGKSTKILSQDMARQMLSPQKGPSGLGFQLEHSGAQLRFGHGGANEGFRCDVEAYAEQGQGLAVMTNSDSGDAVTREYFRAVAKEYGWPDFHPEEMPLGKIDPSTLPAYVGVYEIPDVDQISVSMKNGALFIKAGPIGSEPEQLFPSSATDFFILSHDFTFSFAKDEKGAITKLTVHVGSQNLEAKKISGAPKLTQ